MSDKPATDPTLPVQTPPWPVRARRIAWRIIRLPLLAYVCILVLAMWFENALIYFPSPYPEGDWNPIALPIEEAHFQAADGTRLHGWFVPVENPSAVMLFCHGNAGNITHRADLLRAMHRSVGTSVLAFDYRGYGRSEGTPTEEGVLQDARAARAWLAERAGVAEHDIVLMGESLGGAVAVDLAAHDGARGLVLENSFTSLPDMAAYHYPWLPVRQLMSGRLDSLAKIDQFRGPLLMGHGDADTIVPLRYAERLFAAANEPKQFVTHPGANHNDPRPGDFYVELKAFLDKLPATR